MTLSRLVRVVQSLGMLVGCILLLVAIAVAQMPVAIAGVIAMSPVLVPFVGVEVLGIGPSRRPQAVTVVNDLQGAK